MSFQPVFFKSPVYNVSDIQTKDSPGWEGNNSKNLLIVCKHLDTQKEFLSKILKAVNIDLAEDTAILDCDKQGIRHWAELSKSGIFKKVIFFGIQPPEMGLQIIMPVYQNVIWTTCAFLLADDLRIISEDKNKKQLLWNALKEIFV